MSRIQSLENLDNLSHTPHPSLFMDECELMDKAYTDKSEKSHTHTHSQAKEARHIAEVIIPHIGDSQMVILPMIASLSQRSSSQWITWVTDKMPSKALLESMGANLNGLRIVHASPEDARWITWQALAQGNSHTVIAEQASWSESDLEAMEDAAGKSQTQGIMISLHSQTSN